MNTSCLSRFNAGIQLSEHGLNSIVGALTDFGVIPREISGAFRNYHSPLDLSIEGNYEIDLSTPEIFLDTASGDQLGVRGALQGKCSVELSAGSNARWSYDLSVSAAYEVVTEVMVERSGGEAHFAIRFVELSNLTVSLIGDIPTGISRLLSRLARRMAEVHLLRRVVRIPLSPWFSTQELGGWALEPPVVRIIDGPMPADHDSLTVAFNTWPNRGTGLSGGIKDWVHRGAMPAMVGLAVDERFFLQTLRIGSGALEVPRRFNNQGQPDKNGEVELGRVVVNLREGYIHVTVEAIASIDGKSVSVFAHARAEISYLDNRFRVRIKNVDVEFPWFVHLVGFLLFRLYYLLIAAVVQAVLGPSVSNIGEDLLEDFLNGGAVPLSFDSALGDTPVRIFTNITSIEVADSELRVLSNLKFSTRPTGRRE